MGDYLDTYFKFLIGNSEFFNEIVEKLLSKPKINKELVLKVQRRIKVLRLIDSVSESLERYFYGSDYKYLIDKFSSDDIEFLVEKILSYDKKGVDIKVCPIGDVFFNNISKNSCEKIQNHISKEDIQININSNEIFLEDYEEIEELYYISTQLGDVNLNFKVIDLFSQNVVFENRINENKQDLYINTCITLLRIELNKSYKDLIENSNLDERILNRFEVLDPNPIWKYYLSIIKINNKEDAKIIIDLCNYIYSNVYKFRYLNTELFEKVGAYSLVVLCDIYFNLRDYGKLNECIELLDKEYPNCIDFVYFKAKFLKHKNDKNIDDFLSCVENKFDKKYNQYSIFDSEKIHVSMGEVLEQKGDYVLAAGNFLRGGGVRLHK